MWFLLYDTEEKDVYETLYQQRTRIEKTKTRLQQIAYALALLIVLVGIFFLPACKALDDHFCEEVQQHCEAKK